jgi:pimeloyl-ACP methyl ester carboxylesterase
MKTIVSRDGTGIAYSSTGAGPPLLLVHGGVSDHTRWNPILPALEQRFTVRAMDRRGRGRSGDTEPYAVEREFEDIAAVVDASEEPVHLLAHSFGAACAIGAAFLTSNMRTMMLYEPPPVAAASILPPETAARMRSMLEHGDREGVVTTFMLDVAAIPPQEVATLKTLPSWTARVAAAHTILREVDGLTALRPFPAGQLARLSIPTLLLVGGESPALYTRNIDQLHTQIPNSRVAVLTGQRHMAINSSPDLFSQTVLAFLDGPGS